MTILPWLIGTLGVACLSAVVGFLVGTAWGVNLFIAREDRQKIAPPDVPLAPQYWSPERIAQAVGATPGPRPGPPETPRPYRIPGLDDGD